jgi:chromosomal replication initiation ATPase DnaA
MRQLESAMPQAPYQTYVASLEFISETDNLVLLQSPTDYSAQWCASRLTAQLNRMLTGMRNHPTEIVFTSQE